MIQLPASLSIIILISALTNHGESTLHHHKQQHLHKRQSGPSLTNEYPQHNFTMPIDHFPNDPLYAPHTNGTFTQYYWYDDTYYQAGGPIIVNTMGEDGSFDLTWFQAGLLQQIANATGGLAVLWPQRYYSGGSPVGSYPYTTQQLRFHTTEQALVDLAYFAQRIVFPGHQHKNLTAKTTPWIVIGGSYAGVVSAFSRIKYPDIFWGGLQSSGVSVAFDDNWEYYDVPRRYGPKDCITNQQKFINIVDNILTSGNATRIQQLKAAFGGQSLTSDHDFALVLSYPLSSNWASQTEWLPQYFKSLTGPNSYCGNITSQTLLEPANSTFKQTARTLIANGGRANETSTILNPFLNYITTIRDSYLLRFCGPPLTLNQCWTLQPSPFGYLECMEYGQFATGYIPGTPGHPPFLPCASRLLTVEWEIENCRSSYNLSSSYTGPNTQRWDKYGGFNLSYPRLAISTGEYDLFRPVTPLAADISYGVPNPRLQNSGTRDEPQTVIAKGGHEWDLQGVLQNQMAPGVPPQQVVDVKQKEVQAVVQWVKEWNEAHPAS